MKKLKTEVWWVVHNMLAHPLYQLLWIISGFGFFRPIVEMAEWVHDSTVPNET